jgi:hypothetical protein
LENAVTIPNTTLEARIAKRTAELQKSIKDLQENPRVRDIRVIVPPNACPVCQSIAGTYQKGKLPQLPPDGCSCVRGFEGYCQPMLTEIYP